MLPLPLPDATASAAAGSASIANVMSAVAARDAGVAEGCDFAMRPLTVLQIVHEQGSIPILAGSRLLMGQNVRGNNVSAFSGVPISTR
jgi:hypothetical protein